MQTEMAEFIALPFPFSSKIKIWSFHVVVVRGLQINVQKSVTHRSLFLGCRRRRSFVKVMFHETIRNDDF